MFHRVHRPTLRTGDAATIRDQRWRVSSVSTMGGSSIVEVVGCDRDNRGIPARFILPFESVSVSPPPTSHPRFVTLPRWRRAARTLLADAVPHWRSLRAAARADFTILPFQLEPAVAIVRGDTVRVLIADEVGLGKTIQAGLIAAETIARSPDARVLVVSPAGLCDQWREELQSRFHVKGERLDAEGIARSAAHLIPGVNPWSIHPVAITSFDYVKRPEVIRALETLTWDLIIFDEAHALAGRSDRAAAAAALARRARVVVMLTATPHSGDDEAYARLCALGELPPSFPLMTFRRTRSDIGLSHGRRSMQLRVQQTSDERAMHEALERYATQLADGPVAASPASGLVATVLFRRACSSATSLMRSLERRMALLTEQPHSGMDQLVLPFGSPDSDDQPGIELGIPGLLDTHEEIALIRRLIELARRASSRESKLLALERLLRRARQPALVFTEYRDTLLHVSAALARYSPLELHGALTGRERADVIRRFASGQATVLVATDAASEGLNLHHRCRLVINLELPWTPLRLEQRIGRVDRLGQSRRVHAVQLVARRTAEEGIAARHDDRAASIRAAFDSHPSPVSDLGECARAEARRIATSRLLAAGVPPWQGHEPLVTVMRANRRGRMWIFRLSCSGTAGDPPFETMAGIEDGDTRMIVGEALDGCASIHHAAVLDRIQCAASAWIDLAGCREAAIIGALRDSHARLASSVLQPGLFDRRAERAAAAQTTRMEEAVRRSQTRLATIDRARDLRVDERTALLGICFRT